MKLKTWASVGGLVVLLAILFSWNRIFPVKKIPVTAIDPMTLPGIQSGDAPWKENTDTLFARLRAIGLPALSSEGAAIHIHQHLDIFVDGKPVSVSPNIGVSQAAGFISPLHTHDTTGVIHVESDKIEDFTLGQFFDVWGVRFTKGCIGGYCADATHTLNVYSNGAPVEGDPRTLTLLSHQEIAIVYGTASTTPKTIPTNFTFPAGE